MTARRIGLLFGLGALLCFAFGLFAPASASADRNGKVLLSVGGGAFSTHPAGPLLDTSRLVPGAEVSNTLGIRSGFDVATKVSVQLDAVHDDDNGCVAPEARVDHSCGVGQGDLGHAVVASIDAASSQSGSYHSVWHGSVLRLDDPMSLGVEVSGHSDRWLRLTLAVPSQVGNVVETDTFRFGLRVVLSGHGKHGGSGVGGKHTHKHHHGDGGHHGDSGPGGGSGLAATGFATTLFVTGAVLLVVAGTVLLVAGRRERRATSDGSSTGRREPRPVAPR